MIRTTLLVTATLALGLLGCQKDEPSTATPPLDPSAAQKPAEPVAPPEAPASAAPAAAGTLGGKVLETMDSGGYTYARVDAGGKEIWLAGPPTKLAVGDTVSAQGGQLMRDFRSNTLDRTFEAIYFVGAIGTGDAAPAGGGHGAAPTPGADPHAGLAQGDPAVKVDRLDPPAGGKSIADVFAGKKALAGKEISVRGKVVKFNGGIMGRNWLHLRDGTGAAGANDLTVTTDATARVGDVVVAKGTLALDKDFGGGYRYDVILEGATVSPE